MIVGNLVLAFPESDADSLKWAEMSGKNREVVFTHVVTPLRQESVHTRTLILCRLREKEFESQYSLADLSGFVMRGDRCYITSNATVTSTSRSFAAGCECTVSPGRVGVYVANHMNPELTASQGKKLDSIRPLKGWVEKHPTRPGVARLVGVEELADLQKFSYLYIP